MPFRLRLVHSAMMSFVLCFLMTCWVTFINLGITEHFIMQWSRAFSLSWPAAFIIAFFTGPVVMKIAMKLISPRNAAPKKAPEVNNPQIAKAD
jgi:hypothetical protein